MTDSDLPFTFPAIEGIQGANRHYTCSVELASLLEFLPPVDHSLAPELRAQRALNEGRAFAIADYMASNDTYTLPSITVSVSALSFVPSQDHGRFGMLRIDRSARILCNDGQHRRKAIEIALGQNPSLGKNTLNVVFYQDADIGSAQQRFADLNSGQPAARSVKILYDLRTPNAAREMSLTGPFKGLVEMQAANASAKSDKIWTLSGLDKTPGIGKLAFWKDMLSQWDILDELRAGRVTAADIRKRFIWAHNVTLQGIGFLAGKVPADVLGDIDWSRANPDWEGRAQIGGKMLPTRRNAVLIANLLLKKLGVPLPPSFAQAEDDFAAGNTSASQLRFQRVLHDEYSPVIASYGGGVNGDAMLWWAMNNKQRVDAILFADTGGETPETYAHVKYFSERLVEHGYPAIHVVRKGGNRRTLEEDCLEKGMLPSLAYGMKGCSQKFKREPQDRWANNWTVAIDAWQAGYYVQKWIGYDADESHRGKIPSDDKYSYRYPLVELGWGRDECVEYIKAQGAELPTKSSCFFCPARKKPEIVEMSVRHPELMARAIAMEQKSRTGKNASQTVKGLGRSFSWEEFLASSPSPNDVAGDEGGIDIPCECYVAS